MSRLGDSCYVEVIEDMLNIATSPVRVNELLRKSRISGNTWTRHLKYCREKNLLWEIPLGKKNQNGIALCTSEKGREFLELVQ